MFATRRCLTCKAELGGRSPGLLQRHVLPAGGRSRRAPGRTWPPAAVGAADADRGTPSSAFSAVTMIGLASRCYPIRHWVVMIGNDGSGSDGCRRTSRLALGCETGSASVPGRGRSISAAARRRFAARAASNARQPRVDRADRRPGHRGLAAASRRMSGSGLATKRSCSGPPEPRRPPGFSFIDGRSNGHRLPRRRPPHPRRAAPVPPTDLDNGWGTSAERIGDSTRADLAGYAGMTFRDVQSAGMARDVAVCAIE